MKYIIALLMLSLSSVALAGSKKVTISTKYWISGNSGKVSVRTISGRSLYSATLTATGNGEAKFTYKWDGISAENIIVSVNDCSGTEYSMSTSDQTISPSYCDR